MTLFVHQLLVECLKLFNNEAHKCWKGNHIQWITIMPKSFTIFTICYIL